MNLLSVAILTLLSILLFSAALDSKEHTLILNPILRLSNRRKRTLLFPNYGSIKVTVGIAKGLIGNIPKGLSLSYEMCSYFAGPTVIADLLNEIKQKKPKQQVNNKPNKTKSVRVWHESTHQIYPNNSDTYFSKFSGSSHKHPQLKASMFNPFKTINFSHRSKNMQRLFERSSSDYDSPGMINVQRKSPLNLALDYLLGSDARCAILKPICENREFLLPPGYSMIQDIVRILAVALAKDLTAGGKYSELCEVALYADCDE